MATSVKIGDELKKRIQRLAQARQRTPHWVMREAIRDYVEREEAKERVRQDAMRAWEAYQENGQHLTFEEADAWLARLEAGEDVEPPECHA